MDGERLRNYWSKEVEALLLTYKQFETLIPANGQEGAAHKGEDGRFVEDLLSEYLKKFLPNGIEILTGFILRPAVKTGGSGKKRKPDQDEHSSQLDIIIYDSMNFPVFQRFGDSVVVPPEGVVGIISVKKHLNDGDIVRECEALYQAAKLCRSLESTRGKSSVRGPFLSLVSMKSNIKKVNSETLEWIFERMQTVYSSGERPKYDHLINYIGSLHDFSIHKKKPKPKSKSGDLYAEYIGYSHTQEELHLGLQYILSGILSVYYDETRRNITRPGFTSFPDKRIEKFLGNVKYGGER
ncbi:hypothetical protein CWB99_10470 [Pseudoalteromonas rubra]|uniref:DUF6602 domain-containing protein n=1 Tax=Pseudoalteromonas rubra TaxID=43658 RepID=A0A5S3WLX3_9GAMM|nr:DUF6602 domain-containing protein [Pseudoalteromonas rubra]TMP28597.1 hypothetical protein CWC00_21150 [Pseudoalteromonas rubra]TMP28868.1 hypothetical protein CWB99_10470 [Pseudoalteromonas rubra]